MEWLTNTISSLLGGGDESRSQTASMSNPVSHQANQNQSNPQFNSVHYAPNYITQVNPTQVNPLMSSAPSLPGPALPSRQVGFPGQDENPGQVGYPGQFGHPGHVGYVGQGGQPGHSGYHGNFPSYTFSPPVYPTFPPTPMSSPVNPGYMGNPPAHNPVTPVPSAPPSTEPVVEWVRSTIKAAKELSGRAVVGGYDVDGTDLWIIRTIFESELLPAKLNIGWGNAFVAWKDLEKRVYVFEVCCADKDKIVWVESANGNVPHNAVKGGKALDGETLYIGRTTHGKSLCPGKIHPSHKCLYVSYAYKSHKHSKYEVLCTV